MLKLVLLLAGSISVASSLFAQFGKMWSSIDLSGEISAAREAWNSGRLLLQTTERVRKMTRMIGTARAGVDTSAVVSLPAQLDVMALSIGDYVSHYYLEEPTPEQAAQWTMFSNQCGQWKANLTEAARAAYELQLYIREFASRGATALQLLHTSWNAVTREETYLEVAKLQNGLVGLRQALQTVDARMIAEQEAGSQLIAFAVGKVQASELEIAQRAQTWSWSTTLLVYGAAVMVGHTAGLSVLAPVVVSGIAHFVETRKNDQFKRQLLTQSNLYTMAGAVLTDVRTVVLYMDKELIALDHDLKTCLLALEWSATEAQREGASREQVQVALLAALKDVQSLHVKTERAISAYTGQPASQSKQLTAPG